MAEQAAPAQYGDYDVESFLGKGSIGKVYLARHRRIGRRVALKTVHLEQRFEDEIDQDEFYKRLQREAELCAAMQHPNIVTLYDVGYEHDVVTYLATEYVDGESLLARLRRTRPLPLAEALSIAADLLRGLAYAHSKGVIHRDIKPANILLTADGQAKIADFGVARPLHSSLTATRSLVGTPNYMSPEQVKTTPVSTRSDLFSAGVVAYEMLTGIKPFASTELSGILYNVVNLVPRPAHEVNPSVPGSVSRIIAKLLSKNPDERYPTANEALEDLERAAKTLIIPPPNDGETIAVLGDATTPLPTVIDEPPRRVIPPPLFWLVTLTLLGALIASVVLLRERIDRIQPTSVLTIDQLADTQSKRDALSAARSLVAAGQYEEALRRYDAIRARWPQNLAAAEERGEVSSLIEAAKSKREVTRVARKPRKEKNAESIAEAPPAKPLSRWERLRKWLNEDPQAAKKKRGN